jgi:hypothetical protein
VFGGGGLGGEMHPVKPEAAGLQLLLPAQHDIRLQITNWPHQYISALGEVRGLSESAR